MALLDQYFLAQNETFQNRVRSSLVARALITYAEDQETNGHGKRAALATAVLRNPLSYIESFSIYVATHDDVANDAGTVTAVNSDTQQALVTDIHITIAIASVWNAMAGV